MTPREFIEKWRDNPLKELAGYQMYFLDRCALLGVDPPKAGKRAACGEFRGTAKQVRRPKFRGAAIQQNNY